MTIALIPIGTIRTPFKDLKGMPIQPKGAAGTQGRVVVRSRYQKGLEDLEGFSHIILLYHFHRSTGYRLTVTPYLDDQPHGVFATHSPRRPNPIALASQSAGLFRGAAFGPGEKCASRPGGRCAGQNPAARSQALCAAVRRLSGCKKRLA